VSACVSASCRLSLPFVLVQAASAGAWRKFHNDSSDDKQAYAALTTGLAECVLQVQ